MPPPCRATRAAVVRHASRRAHIARNVCAPDAAGDPSAYGGWRYERAVFTAPAARHALRARARSTSPPWLARVAAPMPIGGLRGRNRQAPTSAGTRTESEDFPSIVHENQIFVEIHWPAEGCDESRKNGG